MKKTFIILTLLSFVMGLTSCHHDEPEEVVADKTILIYMPYTGSNANLYRYFQQNINDIKQSLEEKGFGNNNVLAFVCQNAQEAHLIQFRKSNSKGPAIINDTLMTYNSKSPTTSDEIAEILTTVKQLAPAREYGMIIGAHGEGWLPAEGTTPKKSRWFGSGTAAYQTNLCELVDALNKSDIHLQFVLFDCCYMACVENVYEMRKVADYYISSTSEIMNAGMPYSLFFHSLMSSKPNYEQVVTAFNDYYRNYANPYGTISVSDCSQADQMATVMRQINLSNQLDLSDLANVQDLDAGHYSPTIYYDFGSYVSHCCKNEDLLRQFNDCLEKLVPYKKSTDKIMSDSERQFLEVKEFSGLTVSDPSENQKVKETKHYTQWWNATHEE